METLARQAVVLPADGVGVDPARCGPTSIALDRSVRSFEVAEVRGLAELWTQTLGDPEICIAILDGPVDHSHPSFQGARLTQLDTLVSSAVGDDAASRHGTHVASVIFGGHDGPVKGIAPRCRGVSIPIFESAGPDSFRLCSQIDLARAIARAVDHGAHVINVSGGEFSPSGMAYPLLETLVRECARQGVLIVAAAGNEGCECLHIPAALDAVLAVGAMDRRGTPFGFSNWGSAYQTQGILAPGEAIPGAAPGDGVVRQNGTSYATPLVSGVAALLLSLQRKRGQRPDAAQVREALLHGAAGCDVLPVPDCRRLLAGRLDLYGALTFLNLGVSTMTEAVEVEPAGLTPKQPGLENGPRLAADMPAGRIAAVIDAPPRAEPTPTPAPKTGQSCGCGCKGVGTGTQLVYALGQIGYDLVSEARLDSLVQKMAARARTLPQRGLAYDADQMLAYLQDNPWDAAAIEWTISLDGTPVYTIRPQGPFAGHAYQVLREFLKERNEVDRVSIPGLVTGKAMLFLGQVVPVIVPDLRGMYSWTTGALVDAVVGAAPSANGAADGEEEHARKRAGVRNFLYRVYHELRNLGTMPQERALNFAATNAFEVGKVYESAIKEKMELDSMRVLRSPVSRPGSDCWDVELSFFYPERQVQTVRKVHRMTVDVSDLVPVTVGETRTWSCR
jgi:subtilisin family serine protease